jgi:cation transport regulator
MPYNSIKDLPVSITKHLPKHAQEIYLKAFNNAWEEYKSPASRKDKSSSREEVAHKVAWSAVKAKYRKASDGNWVEKSN